MCLDRIRFLFLLLFISIEKQMRLELLIYILTQCWNFYIGSRDHLNVLRGSCFEVTPLRERGIGGDEWRDQGIDGRTQTHVQSDKNTELWNIGGVEEAFTLTGRRNIRIHTLLIRQMFYWKQFLNCSETVYIYRRHNYVQLYVISTPTSNDPTRAEHWTSQPMCMHKYTHTHYDMHTRAYQDARIQNKHKYTPLHAYMRSHAKLQYIYMNA